MSKEKLWYLYAKKADFDAISKKYNISPILARIIINRNIPIEKIGNYLKPSIGDLHDENSLKDIEGALRFVASFIDKGTKLRIVGDYDIDGVCATYILVAGLKYLGANISYEIPDRIKDGYGINELIIEEAYKDGVELILTCDNGIAAFSAIDKAKDLGINIIVTDHHDIRKEDDKEILPKADFIINPKQEACKYPFKGICGANVAYKFISALYSFMNKDKSLLEGLFDFVAIATVGDVMELRDENRYIVKKGLESIEATKNLGLRLLIEECDLENKTLNPFHIGFVLGPCLNAGGRLKSAKIALELFLEKNKEIAMKKAKELVELNNDRKELTLKGVEKAISIVEEKYIDDKVLVIYLDDCHESLAGIIAGRIKEKYYRPTIVLTDAHEGLLKGSARSIETYNIFEKLVEADKFLTKYGGHPMAAGLSIKRAVLDEFREFLNEHSNLEEKDLIEKIWIDIALPFSYISQSFIAELDLLEPFGNGNEKPSFALKNVYIHEKRVFGKDRNVVKLILEDDSRTKLEALLFANGDEFLDELGENRYIDIIYYPQVNEYMNKRNIQIIIKVWKNSRI